MNQLWMEHSYGAPPKKCPLCLRFWRPESIFTERLLQTRGYREQNKHSEGNAAHVCLNYCPGEKLPIHKYQLGWYTSSGCLYLRDGLTSEITQRSRRQFEAMMSSVAVSVSVTAGNEIKKKERQRCLFLLQRTSVRLQNIYDSACCTLETAVHWVPSTSPPAYPISAQAP